MPPASATDRAPRLPGVQGLLRSPIAAPEGEMPRKELSEPGCPAAALGVQEGVGRGQGCTAPGMLGGLPQENTHNVEVQRTCPVVNARQSCDEPLGYACLLPAAPLV